MVFTQNKSFFENSGVLLNQSAFRLNYLMTVISLITFMKILFPMLIYLSAYLCVKVNKTDWVDSNQGPLVSEATTLLTVP